LVSKNAFQEHLTASQMRVNSTELDRPVKSPVSGLKVNETANMFT